MRADLARNSLPISLYAQWTSPYINSYLSLYFTVRARLDALSSSSATRPELTLSPPAVPLVRHSALGSLIIAILGVISNFLLGAFLDNTRFSKKARARGAYLIIMFTLGGVWIWATVIQVRHACHSLSDEGSG